MSGTRSSDRQLVLAALPPETPVVVGVGIVSQREDDPKVAREPIELMLEAARRAGAATGNPVSLGHVSKISVPKGRWRYRDPGRWIAERIGAPGARTEIALVGVLQQTLIANACQSVQDGTERAVLVVGGEAGHRMRSARKLGLGLDEITAEGTADIVLKAQTALVSEAETAAGLQSAVGLYALLDCAFRASKRQTLQQRATQIGARYAQFSRIAAKNPHAWSRTGRTAEEIATPSRANAAQALPYNRLHCADWSVDQASALLVTSVGLARALGIASDRWVFPLGSSECNQMLTVSSRREPHRSPGARIAAAALLDHAGMSIAEVDLLDLYSCFPVAVDIVADELGVAPNQPVTITGGMASAGGPFNNYVLQATAQVIERLGAGEGRTGLVGCISGILTKQGFGVWSAAPPERRFAAIDVTGQVTQADRPLAEKTDYRGMAKVVAWTHLTERGAPARAIVLADTSDGERCVAASDDPGTVAALSRHDPIGAMVRVDGAAFKV